MTINPMSLNSSSLARALGAVAFILVLASVGGQLMAYLAGHGHRHLLVRLVYVDHELNIPTAFSALLLLFAARLLWVITVLRRRLLATRASHWAFLSWGFLLMAADEAFMFHEKLIGPTRALLGDGTLGIFYFAWVIPASVGVCVVALLFSRFLWRLPTATRIQFTAAAIIFLGGAIGVELIGGRFAEIHGTFNLTYSMIATVEESLEMLGTIVFIWALLRYIAEHFRDVQIGFGEIRGELA